MPEKAPRKVAAKRVSRVAKKSATEKVVAPKKTPSRTTPKRVAASAATATVRRKAPTPVAAVVESRRSLQRTQLVGIAIFVVCILGSAVVGYTDAGKIDVRGVIESRKSNATEDERVQLDRVGGAVQNDAPFGGLVPSSDQSEQGGTTVPEVVGTSTDALVASSTVATSTDSVATSTEPVVTDGATLDQVSE